MGMFGKCGKQWKAQWIAPPGSGVEDRMVTQKYILEDGHQGDHRSQTNVTRARRDDGRKW